MYEIYLEENKDIHALELDEANILGDFEFGEKGTIPYKNPYSTNIEDFIEEGQEIADLALNITKKKINQTATPLVKEHSTSKIFSQLRQLYSLFGNRYGVYNYVKTRLDELFPDEYIYDSLATPEGIIALQSLSNLQNRLSDWTQIETVGKETIEAKFITLESAGFTKMLETINMIDIVCNNSSAFPEGLIPSIVALAKRPEFVKRIFKDSAKLTDVAKQYIGTNRLACLLPTIPIVTLAMPLILADKTSFDLLFGIYSKSNDRWPTLLMNSLCGVIDFQWNYYELNSQDDLLTLLTGVPIRKRLFKRKYGMEIKKDSIDELKEVFQECFEDPGFISYVILEDEEITNMSLIPLELISKESNYYLRVYSPDPTYMIASSGKGKLKKSFENLPAIWADYNPLKNKEWNEKRECILPFELFARFNFKEIVCPSYGTVNVESFIQTIDQQRHEYCYIIDILVEGSTLDIRTAIFSDHIPMPSANSSKSHILLRKVEAETPDSFYFSNTSEIFEIVHPSKSSSFKKLVKGSYLLVMPSYSQKFLKKDQRVAATISSDKSFMFTATTKQGIFDYAFKAKMNRMAKDPSFVSLLVWRSSPTKPELKTVLYMDKEIERGGALFMRLKSSQGSTYVHPFLKPLNHKTHGKIFKDNYIGIGVYGEGDKLFLEGQGINEAEVKASPFYAFGSFIPVDELEANV